MRRSECNFTVRNEGATVAQSAHRSRRAGSRTRPRHLIGSNGADRFPQTVDARCHRVDTYSSGVEAQAELDAAEIRRRGIEHPNRGSEAQVRIHQPAVLVRRASWRDFAFEVASHQSDRVAQVTDFGIDGQHVPIANHLVEPGGAQHQEPQPRPRRSAHEAGNELALRQWHPRESGQPAGDGAIDAVEADFRVICGGPGARKNQVSPTRTALLAGGRLP